MQHILISSRKGLIVYSRSKGSWNFDALHFEGIPVTLSHFDQKTHKLWAFQDHGHWGVKISVSPDFGRSWESVEPMKFPEGSELADGTPASLRYIWAATSRNEDLWIGTVPGGLFHSGDVGKTFTLNRTLWHHPDRKSWFGGGMDQPGIHSICVDPEDKSHVFTGISVGGVYETRDGGESWSARNKGLRADFLPDPYAETGHDPHLLVMCPAAPNVMWQQNHCGIFRTSDGAQTWKDISEVDGPAKFGFAIAAHEKKPETAWVVPALSDVTRVAVGNALCVSRTDDGGKSWKALRKGLPQDNCFDIVYRHALDTKGSELVFGTTTGNLFYSDDGGDHWKAMTNYLPMIHAVTFAET